MLAGASLMERRQPTPQTHESEEAHVMSTSNATSHADAEVPLHSNPTAREGRAATYLTTGLVWRGLLAIGIGVVSVVWPDITVGAFVILFAVYAFLAAIADAARAFTRDKVGPVVGYLVLSLLSVAAGVVALVWPGPTALVLTLIVGWWAFVTGAVELAMAFASGRTAGERAWWILSGLVSIAFAAVLFVRPDIGAESLAIVFGLYSIFYGVTALMAAQQVRDLGRTARRTVEALS
jgi:uncharacterized membrane protein HdeD (DUF308 family)